MEGLVAAGVTAWRNNGLDRSQMSVYFQAPEGQNVNSGPSHPAGDEKSQGS